MRFSTLISASVLTAAAVSAVPHHSFSSRQAAKGQTAVYWGQNGPGSSENNDLSTYCTSTSGIDIIILSFLYEFGLGGQIIPSGVIGESCYISTTGAPQECDNVVSSITTCQNAGVKVLLSVGGASASYALSSQAEAEAIGQYLWDSYGNSGNTTVQRPFGDAIVDGWDFDIEMNQGSSQYFQYMISTLRSNFASDSSKSYVITGAPQCPIPEPNMGVIIGNSTFDHLWVQFYNNNNGLDNDPYESCSLGFGANAPFNYDQWVQYLATTPSANASIFVGVPASTMAASGTASGENYYITPAQLQTLVAETSGNSTFGGVMLWDAGYSDLNVNDGCNFAQEAYSILTTGNTCSGSPVSRGSTFAGNVDFTKKKPASKSKSIVASSSKLASKTASASASHHHSSSKHVATPTSSAHPKAACPTKGASCPKHNTYACSGSSFARCNQNVWELNECGSGSVCVQTGNSIFCDASGNSTAVCT